MLQHVVSEEKIQPPFKIIVTAPTGDETARPADSKTTLPTRSLTPYKKNHKRQTSSAPTNNNTEKPSALLFQPTPTHVETTKYEPTSAPKDDACCCNCFEPVANFFKRLCC